jgi:hypothetical protein
MTESPPVVGRTVRETASLFRVGTAKVLGWIRAGELRAVNTAAGLSAKPRWVILPDALDEFAKRRAGVAQPKPTRRRRLKPTVDYYP